MLYIITENPKIRKRKLPVKHMCNMSKKSIYMCIKVTV